MPVIAARTRLLSDLPEHFHFALGKTDVHEWEIDLDTGALRFISDPGIFKGIPSLKALLGALHPEDRCWAERIAQSLMLKADRCYYECRLVDSNGDVRWISVSGCSEGEEGQIERLYGITQDITERKRAEAVAKGQRRALELAVTGAPLESILELLCRLSEEQASGSLQASIMLLDSEGHLQLAAAPTLPPEYCKAIGRLVIGPCAGSCGTAAFLAEPIVATDIEHDERWAQFAHLALPHGLRACWSLPLLSPKGLVQGTMALYCRERRGPRDWESESVTLLANTASLIIERYRETHERSRAELRFRSLVSATNAIVWTTSRDVEVFTPLPEWGSYTGLSSEQMKGMGWLDAIHPDDGNIIREFVLRMRKETKPLQTEVRLRRADGEFRDMALHAVPILDASGAVKEWAGSYTDVTERNQSEQRLRHQATHDALTGLPNRLYLNEHLQELLDFTAPSESIAVMLIDLDRFKHINDSMGHDSGDELLCLIAKRLLNAIPRGDLVARLGGDEFVVVAHVPNGKASAQTLAQTLLQTLASPVDVEGSLLYSAASIGVCLYPDNGQRKDVLLQNADIAMYKAKADGGNRYSFFSEEMSVAMKKRMALEIALRGALDRGEFVLHYQPRVGLPNQELRGVEALVRWNSPGRGLVSPLDFIPIAEETGLINEIGIWVLRQACADIQALNVSTGRSLCVSVNLSPNQLMDPNLVHQVKDALDQAGMQPKYLELELTEGALIHDMDASTLAMQQLKALGVLLAVDDFGTGHAGIEYLRQFPIDTVKLDRTFVTPISLEPHGFEFLKALSDMAHALGLHVVAEGVEDRATLDLLCKAQCDEAQGYLFANPLPLAGLVAYVEEWESLGRPR
ncbi:EAL domain-containing protein [Pseudomonas sp.]|uniref:sensor domain-containing protein n=1 Tax=Pseudomonas sp. TaxID=306 RepID=UPI0028A1DEC8|nr:EAL domain-containing protein [Pseudomonas sp.]